MIGITGSSRIPGELSGEKMVMEEYFEDWEIVESDLIGCSLNVDSLLACLFLEAIASQALSQVGRSSGITFKI